VNREVSAGEVVAALVAVASVELQLTPSVKRALKRARSYLTLRGDQQIESQHLLLGLVEEPDSSAVEMLARARVDRAQVRRRVLEALAGTAG
jgi:ATP-dependent Clp protease ATP-binding subunit ClpA